MRPDRPHKLVVALVAAGAAFGIATAVQASVPDAHGVIRSCYHVNGQGQVDGGANLRVIDPASQNKDGQACKNNEVELDWNQKGPTGPAGTQGPAGAAGPAGAQGPAGPQGPKGMTGLQGPAGSSGARGATGPSGPAGSGPVTIGGGSGDLTVPPNTERWIPAFESDVEPSSGDVQQTLATSGTLRDFHVWATSTAGFLVLTIWHNGSKTSVSCTVGDGDSCSDTADSETFSAGDQIAVSALSVEAGNEKVRWTASYG